MKKALLIIDVQNGITNKKDFTNELTKINSLISDFTSNQDEIIFIKNVDYTNENSFFYFKKTDNTDLHINNGDYPVFEKSKPNAFSNSKLHEYLQQKEVGQVVIAGFNTEFCCLFTAIVAESKGYKVCFIEDACGTVNDDEVYEMPGLDINDFVGTILDWSDVITVSYYDEFRDEYLA